MSSSPPAVNISANASDWRGQALSNFCLSPFVLDGALYASIEGFIQGIKFPEGDPVRAAAFQASGWDAKRLGDDARRDAVHWQGARIAYGSPEHHRLIERAIRARVSQSTGLRQALASTAGAAIAHETGAPESPATSLPATVFCHILETLREDILAGTLRGKAEAGLPSVARVHHAAVAVLAAPTLIAKNVAGHQQPVTDPPLGPQGQFQAVARGRGGQRVGPHPHGRRIEAVQPIQFHERTHRRRARNGRGIHAHAGMRVPGAGLPSPMRVPCSTASCAS